MFSQYCHIIPAKTRPPTVVGGNLLTGFDSFQSLIQCPLFRTLNYHFKVLSVLFLAWQISHQVAAVVGAAQLGKVFGHSQAEKAFRPWWDSLEDYLYLIYCLVMIGVGLVPTAIVTSTPLDCNFCQRDCCGGNINWCGGHGAEVQLQTHHHRLLLRCGSVGG